MGEGPLLTFEEKRKVIESVVQSAGGRVPVLAGVGCPSTRETMLLAEAAEAVGADALIVVTPYYYSPNRDGLLAHYRAVAGATGIPTLVYHIPSRTGNHLPLDLIPPLTEIPQVIGLKDSSGDVSWLQSAMAVAPEWRYFVGSDALLRVGFSLGVHGAVSGVANLFPELVVSLYGAAQAGNHERVQELQATVMEIRSAVRSGPYLSGMKAGLRALDHDIGEPRLPMVGMNDEQESRLRKQLLELSSRVDLG
jgi:4-hydroxy-tetrahydrodipicolinate synthase/2-dehydro-3-deoxy-phosphogluconate/2-dehydro-3-deoxy-6-phosphogalactonate aldolase